MMPLIGIFGGGNAKTGFLVTMSLLAVIIAPVCFSAYFFLREKNIAGSAEKPPLKKMYKAILQNKRLLLFFAGYCIFYMADSFRSQTAYYFVTYNLGRQELLPIIIMAGLISPLLMQPLIPKMLAFASKEALVAIGTLGASAVGFLLLAFSDYPYALIAAAILYGVFTAVFGNLNFAVMASFADEMHKRHNMYMSDILAATSTLFYKVGIAIASGAAPLIMSMTGYAAQAARQSGGALMGIKMLYITCNAAALAVAGVIMIFVRLRKET
jgi:Na+/melibiose symporter-like transporter